MRIALTLTPPTDQFFQWAAQIGVSDFVCRYPRHYGLDPSEGLKHMHDRAARFGLRLSVVEGYLPIDDVVVGKPGRDAQIDELCALVRQMGRLGIEVLCYNFMPNMDWMRTSFTTPQRGGALVSSFDAAELGPRRAPADRCLPTEMLWENLEHLLKKLVPVAEDAGVKLAMHPDDPPMATLLGANQILHSVEAFERLVQLVPSEVNGVCFCQGTFAETGVDIPTTIRRLAKHIHYVHFRDVEGVVPRFHETFHDNGKTDMVAAMRAYQEIGFRGPMRPDHVPQLAGEETDSPGYTMLGRLFAVGYMRGLMQAVTVE